MAIKSSGQLSLNDDIRPTINIDVDQTDVSLGDNNAEAFTAVADGATVTGRSMSEMYGYSAFNLFPSTEADGALGESLLFDDNNHQLYHTPTLTGNRKTFTWSGWFKLNKTGTNEVFFEAGDTAGNQYISLRRNTSNQLYVLEGRTGANGYLATSNALITDTNAWYHIVFAVDTVGDTDRTKYEKFKVYANGVLLSFSHTDTDLPADQDLAINTSSFRNAVARTARTDQYAAYLQGIVADVKFIDGQQLTPDHFGELKNGIWVPKAYAKPSTDTEITTNIVQDYNFNGSAVDETGNYNGTESGINYHNTNYGIAEFPTSASLTASRGWSCNTAYTISFWALFPTDSTDHAFFIWQDGGTNQKAVFVNYDSSVSAYQWLINHKGATNTGNTYRHLFTGDGQWHFYTATFNGTDKGNLYVDGVKVQSNFPLSPIADVNSSLYLANRYRYNNTTYAKKSIAGRLKIMSVELTASEVLQEYNATKHKYAYGLNGFHLPLNNTSAGAIVDDTSLKLHLDASNSSSYGGSGTTWSDLTTNNNDGTISGAGFLSSTNGGVFDFDGSNDKVTITTLGTFLASSDNKTYSAWFKSDGPSSGNREIFSSYGDGTNNFAIRLYMRPHQNSGDLVYGSKAGGNIVYGYSNTTNINNGKWYHACVVHNTALNTLTLYVNGKFDGAVNIGSGTANGDFYIGTYGTGYYWDGKIAQARVYNKALTAQEVIQNYRATQGNYEQVSTVDISGNAQVFTASNIDYTDHIKDEPANNYPIFSFPQSVMTYSSYNISNSGLTVDNPDNAGSDYSRYSGPALPTTGKWYWEVTYTGDGSGYALFSGIAPIEFWYSSTGSSMREFASSYGIYGLEDDGEFWALGTNTLDLTTLNTTDKVAGFAYDADNGSLYIYIENTIQNSGSAVATGLSGQKKIVAQAAGSSAHNGLIFDFGQNGFTYSIPSGYKSLASSNLPAPEFDQGALDDGKPSDYFKPVLYEGSATQRGEDYGWKKGKGAAVFNGSSSKINTGYIHSGQIFSVSFWGKDFSANGSIIRDTPSAGGTNTRINIITDTDKSPSAIFYGGSTLIFKSSGADVNEWRHYVLTADGTNVKWYENGVETASDTYTQVTGNNSTAVHIMSNGAYSVGYASGKLSDIRIYSDALTSAEVGYLYNDTTASIPTDNLVAHYPLNRNSKDIAPHGKIDRAAFFNGSSSVITLPNEIEDPIISTSAFTVSGWFNTNSVSTDQFILQMYQDMYLDIRVDSNGTLGAKVANSAGTNTEINGTTSLSTNTWYHFIFTGDSDKIELFLNNSSEGSSTAWDGTFFTTTNVQPRIGARGIASGQRYFNGEIDQIRIFNKEVSSSERSTLYAENSSSSANKAVKDIFSDGSGVALYQLDGNALATQGNGYLGGNAPIFNGVSSKIVLPNSTKGIGTPSSSFSFWVKPVSVSSGYQLVCLLTNNDWIEIRYNSSGQFQIYPARQSNDTYISFSAVTKTAGKWYNIVITRDAGAGTIKLYIDGTLEQTNTSWDGTLTSAASSPNGLGANVSSNTLWFGGELEQIRFFDKALSSSEVTTLKNETASSTTLDTADILGDGSCVAHYRLDGHSKENVNGYHGSDSNITYGIDGTESNITYSDYDGTDTSVTYTNTEPSGQITTGFAPDFVWIKQIDGTNAHGVYDVVRGAGNLLVPNLADKNNFYTTVLNSFNSDGFSLGTSSIVNTTKARYVGYSWKAGGRPTSAKPFMINGTGYATASAASLDGGEIDPDSASINTNAGFSILKWEGTGSNGKIAHGLDKAPEIVIVKDTEYSSGYNWYVFTNVTGTNKRIEGLNTNGAASTQASQYNTDATYINNLTNLASLNTNGNQMIAYAWHSVEGYSSIGYYKGNGNDNGPFIHTGFKPAWILVRTLGTTGDNWTLWDTAKEVKNDLDNAFFPNANYAQSSEDFGRYAIDIYSNGFKLLENDGQINSNGVEYLYMAFAQDASKYATASAIVGSYADNDFAGGHKNPRDYFDTVLYTGNGGTNNITTNFKPGLVWIKGRSSGDHNVLYDAVRGANKEIYSSLTNQESAQTTGLTSFNKNGFSLGSRTEVNRNTSTYVAWVWKADGNIEKTTGVNISKATKLENKEIGFGIYEFTTVNSDNQIGYVEHTLDQTPELVLSKELSGSGNWYNYHWYNGKNRWQLFTTAQRQNPEVTDAWGKGITSSRIGFQTAQVVDKNARTVFYAFHSVPGFSKVGMYTGDGGTSNVINVGFTPSFVMLKPTNVTDNWMIYDRQRGDNKVLFPNLSNTDTTYTGRFEFTQDGFKIKTTNVGWNSNDKQYIYLAIA
jgi:hypothetical protein